MPKRIVLYTWVWRACDGGLEPALRPAGRSFLLDTALLDRDMPRDLILHIGTSKTGSTSIQNLLDINRPALLAQGICYPATPGGNTHLLLASAFTSFPTMYNDPDNPLWQGRKPEAAIADHLAQLRAEVAGLSGDTTRIILSCEQFSMYERTEADIVRLRDFALTLADRCTVVVYLRRQDEHFASLYSQFLRLGNIDEPNMGKLHPFHQDYDYSDFMARWANVFGKENVVPRIFERGTDKRFDVLADFAGVSGFDLTLMRFQKEAVRNQSMTLAGQEMLRRFGRRLQADSPDRNLPGQIWQRAAKAVSDTSPGKGWLPTQAEARAFMEGYAASNDIVRSAYFPDKASLFQTSFDALPMQAETVPLEAVVAATVEALLASLKDGVAREVRFQLEKAKLAQAFGDVTLRRNALSQAVRLDSSNVNSRLRLAECLAEQGDMSAAQQQLAVAAKLAPGGHNVAVVRRKLMAIGKASAP